MKKINPKRLFFAILFSLLLAAGFFKIGSHFVAVKADQLQEINDQIKQYETEISRLKSQANTLSNQIAQFDAQIRLTTLKIQETQEKILLLGGRINQLEISLEALTEAFATRATETYKMTRLGDSLIMLITASDLGEVVSRYHYLQRIQEADRDLLVRLQEAQDVYEEEKDDQESLQAQLEEQGKVLGAQKTAKAELLAITRNDEKRYQNLLAKARAELAAIQAIIAGRGEETEVGFVSEGSRIASVIPSVSACSSGAHLHFEVVQGGAHQNPANVLIPKSVIWDNTPDGQFGFSGSWQWPLNDPIRITQGYGMTYYASVLKYYGGSPHTGLDMVNSNDHTVKAARSGTLYRGAIGCGGGTLRYVRVQQRDGYDTYYLHVNY
jgi:peptidoglycan hydrolase CwlO-like protein